MDKNILVYFHPYLLILHQAWNWPTSDYGGEWDLIDASEQEICHIVHFNGYLYGVGTDNHVYKCKPDCKDKKCHYPFEKFKWDGEVTEIIIDLLVITSV